MPTDPPSVGSPGLRQIFVPPLQRPSQHASPAPTLPRDPQRSTTPRPTGEPTEIPTEVPTAAPSATPTVSPRALGHGSDRLMLRAATITAGRHGRLPVAATAGG